MKRFNKNTFIIILLLFAFYKMAKAGDYFEFTGVVVLEDNVTPVPNYPVFFMINDDSLNCIQSITNDNGIYSKTIFLNQNDTLTVFTFDCNGVKHKKEFTTYETLNFADFSICVNSGNCQAIFDTIPDSSNPLAYYFINLSIGDYNLVFWDFNDGTTSNEISPYHVFPQEGIYMVSLMIMDTLTPDGCVGFVAQPVYVGNGNPCSADFSVTLDTLNNTPRVYQFFNESTGDNLRYFWDFGDEDSSEEENPIHIYNNGGEYQVSLMVMDTTTQCYDETSQTIVTPNYYSFGGQAFLGNYPININPEDHNNSATALLYRKVENRWYYMDKREFWQLGYYWFTDKPEGDYLIKVKLDAGSESYDQYAPSYYKHASIWKWASTFTLNEEVFEEPVNLVELAAMDNGINQIAGKVVFDNSRKEMDNVLVQLYNKNNELVKYTYSDEQGNYEFNHLPDGSFFIRGEVVGFCSSKTKVSLTAGGVSPDNTKITIFDCGAIGIDETPYTKPKVAMELYPVPANDNLTVLLNTSEKIQGKVSIINVQGKTVLSRPVNISQQTTLNINISSLQGGIYLIILHNNQEKQVMSKKIIISH